LSNDIMPSTVTCLVFFLFVCIIVEKFASLEGQSEVVVVDKLNLVLFPHPIPFNSD